MDETPSRLVANIYIYGKDPLAQRKLGLGQDSTRRRRSEGHRFGSRFGVDFKASKMGIHNTRGRKLSNEPVLSRLFIRKHVCQFHRRNLIPVVVAEGWVCH